MSEKIKALYGFSPDLPLFAVQTPAGQAALLQSWGCDAVFGGYQSREFVEAARQEGLKIYAELPCFIGEKWWQDYPDSRPITGQGELLAPEGWYYGVNPAIPAVRQERLIALEKLLREYELDGVWLDFIRWPCRWEGRDPYRPLTSFDPITLARFGQEHGLQLPLEDPAAAAEIILKQYEESWTAWRCDQITAWVAEARAVVGRVRPETSLGLFSVPWRQVDHEGAMLKIIGQDYRALAPYVDIFSPMVYHRMCDQPLSWIEAVTAEVYQLSGKPVWPIIQAVDKPEPWPAEEYGQAIDLVLRSPVASGMLVFNLTGVLAGDRLAVTQAKFKELDEP